MAVAVDAVGGAEARVAAEGGREEGGAVAGQEAVVKAGAATDAGRGATIAGAATARGASSSRT